MKKNRHIKGVYFSFKKAEKLEAVSFKLLGTNLILKPKNKVV